MAEEGKKTRQFRAEVKKVLQILTNSLYTNREIFLRELVSNASDALDKLRYQTNKGDKPNKDLPLEIRISIDKVKKTVCIEDTGIGMTSEELSENLGTIAKSGSEAFLAGLEKQNSNIIGRFGVGFYSVFMVANKVEVSSTPAFGDNKSNVWSSDGLGSYTISTLTEDAPKRGTKILIYLKEDAEEFLEEYRLSSALKKHSAFIPFDLYVEKEKINTQPAIWREPKSSVKSEQYNEFYKALTYDGKDPLDVQHISVDAPVQFNALLYIPEKAQEFFGADRDFWGLDLYSRRVLIQHRNKEILPEYLAFLKGVIDTEDLPLNISRETLQENVILRKINQVIVKQTLSHLEKLAKDDTEKYLSFFREHGKIFKLGYQDFANRERIASLFRFNSSYCEDSSGLISLDSYIERAKEGQKTIWYVAAPNREACKMNPHVEIFHKKGLEVLYLYEPVDEFVMGGLNKYKDWEFKAAENATEDALKNFKDTEKTEKKANPLSNEDSSTFDKLLKSMKKILGDKVEDVRISHRLADSPAVLVSKDGSMTSSMEKLLKVMNKDDSVPVKILEVNQDHELLRNMLRIFKANKDDPIITNLTEMMFDSCLLLDGYLKDPQEIASRSNHLLAKASAWYSEINKLS